MNLWFPFCKKDRARAQEWLEWCGELGMHQHTIVLHPAQELGSDQPQMLDLARKAFATALLEPDREGHTGWPQGPNCAFRQAAWFFYMKPEPWIFMECDAWALTPDPSWLDRIEAAYRECGKPFMGDYVPSGDGYGEHMSGVAVYPHNLPDISPKTVTAHNTAFDVASPADIIKQFHKTPLIQHVWEHPRGDVPVFKTLESLGIIRKDAVLFHRNKDCTLPRRLRESRRPVQTVTAEVTDGRPVVYTYYDPVPSMPSQEWMLQKWSYEWTRLGFLPKILSRQDAMSHANFAELEKHFQKYPSINPLEYELACWLRWIAMVQVGGGLMLDYDVLPYGFSKAQLDLIVSHSNGSLDSLPVILMDHNPCPCAVYGTAKEFNNAVIWFANNEKKCSAPHGGKPHASDQTGVQSGPPWRALDICWQMGRPGWEKASLVHFSHSACAGRPREQVIPEAEKMRAAAVENPRLGNALIASIPVELKLTPLGEAMKEFREKEENVLTWIDRIRASVEFLLTESKVSDNNRTRIMLELKRVGLTPGGVKYAPEKMKKGKKKLAKI